jgi:DNA-binding response OmpR family regulator
VQLLIAHKDAASRAALARAIAGDDDSVFEVVECSEGGEALELLLADDSPRLAVVEWDLPGIDGPELCRLVRAFHLGGPPYMVLLAGSGHPDVGEGLGAGANDCIRIPAPASEIRERVHAGRRFVEMPWEHAARDAGLQAVVTADDEAEAWVVPASGSTRAGAGASASGRAELQALLGEF